MIGIGYFVIGLLQAFVITARYRPRLVVGTGGYVSAPVLIAAWALRIETAICEQNSIPGLTNRMLGKLVKHVFVAFEDTIQFFSKEKTVCTGNPVRREFLQGMRTERQTDQRFCILILGGSQGARSLNQGMVSTLDRLRPLGDKLEFIHQTGFRDCAWVQEAYEVRNLIAKVAPFIDDMSNAYRKADLVLSRAGAITVTEVLVSGKAAILVPYPHAAYNHQEMNARAVVDKGAARMILDKMLNDETLGNAILNLYHDPQLVHEMGIKARCLAEPEAAQSIVNLLTG
jgi:UDP-N-acetylglucosamine--N-acetylmuramyl-(pentapeptide) pyrophosphoryl-undecaprenol N-acetylglucosamine transferase